MLPMNWRITPRPPLAGDRAAGRHQIAGDDLQQRGLARAVGPDQGDDGTLANAKGHVVEQHPPVGQVIADPGELDVSHGRPC